MINRYLESIIGREFNKQVQNYEMFLKKHSFGVEKFNFFLGLSLIFAVNFVIFC